MRRSLALAMSLAIIVCGACRHAAKPSIVIGSKFFTEQVVLAELLAQHIEARTGIHVQRKTNLGGTLLVHKAMQAGEIDLYVEYTGTALTAILDESPQRNGFGDSNAARQGEASDVYRRVKKLYAERFHFEVTEGLGFENTFAMVIRGDDAQHFHLQRMSDLVPVASKFRVGVGYEFLERPDGFRGWSERYGLHFPALPKVMDLGLLYRALADRQVDVVAGNSTDGVIDALNLVILEDDRRYFPPYQAVPVVRQETLETFPELRSALADLEGKISSAEMRHLNYLVDGEQRDVATVVRDFRTRKAL
ncbi:MAG: glycine betaine ABC transporter substrate-binding protein [Candidatus Acidiferrum sp.]